MSGVVPMRRLSLPAWLEKRLQESVPAVAAVSLAQAEQLQAQLGLRQPPRQMEPGVSYDTVIALLDGDFAEQATQLASRAQKLFVLLGADAALGRLPLTFPGPLVLVHLDTAVDLTVLVYALATLPEVQALTVSHLTPNAELAQTKQALWAAEDREAALLTEKLAMERSRSWALTRPLRGAMGEARQRADQLQAS